jgi:hypothetical protein
MHRFTHLPLLRRFLLVRDVDVSGSSGCGVVADGVLSDSGKAALFWRGGRAGARGIGLYDSLDDLRRIHGHDGLTMVEFID